MSRKRGIGAAIEENAWLLILFGLPVLGGLFAYLAHWSPVELIILVAILVAAAIIMTGLLFWRRVRMVQADAALKQAMLQRGLSPDEMERLLRAESTTVQSDQTDEQAIEELVANLAQWSVSADEMERILAAVRNEDPGKMPALCASIITIADASGGNVPKIFAVLRGLTTTRLACPETE